MSIRSPRSPTNIPAQRRKPVPGYSDTDLIDLASDSTARVSTTTSSSTLSMEFWTPLNDPYGNTESAAASDPFRDPDPPNTNKHAALAALALSDDPFKDPVLFNAPGQKRLSVQSASSSQRSVSPQFGFAV
ncbi:hypothetical protein PLEOSDRAFT_1088754 [Pleurotus ostreatus PC15]|nr:hypothetical protein PLEOSDRAFT_1088754 [Pleurotus ostreatus PC15]